MERILPTSVQDFEKLRREGFVYVDKTQYVWNLVQRKSNYFLSRPRRFGKSLFISTLEAYFRGKKECFTGLAIESLENDRGSDAWTEYPVITFYLASGEFYTDNGLRDKLSDIIDDCARGYGLTEDSFLIEKTLTVRFSNLIKGLKRKYDRPVVVLVDEYDNPLLKAGSKEREKRNRDLYKSFFSVLKDDDKDLKMAFFTGVTKFSKVSIFSDLNQLDDISLWDDFSGICGFTETEIKKYFTPEIREMSEKQHMTSDECLAELKDMYDGYHFSENSEDIYNPYSLINALDKKAFDNYWFESATPGFLIDKLTSSQFRPEQFVDGVDCTEKQIKDYRTDNPDPVPLFYQSGYLTIKEYDSRFRTFSLAFPNREVRYSFFESLVPYVLGEKDDDNPLSVRNMVKSIENGDTEGLHDILYSIFASIPYMEKRDIPYESVWRNQIYLIFELVGEFVTCEQHTSKGRSDCLLETSEYVYIFEFKVDKSADEALTQIEEKDYAGRFRSDNRQIIKIGADFSSTERNIEDWKCTFQ